LGSPLDTILYESPHRVERLLREIVDIDGDRELFIAKELTKLHQLYIRDSAKDILEMFHNSTLNSRGEWVVIIKGKPTDRDSLSVDDIINMDIPPKVKSKLLSKLLNNHQRVVW